MRKAVCFTDGLRTASVRQAMTTGQMQSTTSVSYTHLHGLTCLLHEKPFAGVNGSGKHNNWSLISDDGINLLNPGDTPHENVQFLLVLACILKAVDVHADLLRESASNVGNDLRLGGHEAPPAIISVFLDVYKRQAYLLVGDKAQIVKTGGDSRLAGYPYDPRFPACLYFA